MHRWFISGHARITPQGQVQVEEHEYCAICGVDREINQIESVGDDERDMHRDQEITYSQHL